MHSSDCKHQHDQLLLLTVEARGTVHSLSSLLTRWPCFWCTPTSFSLFFVWLPCRLLLLAVLSALVSAADAADPLLVPTLVTAQAHPVIEAAAGTAQATLEAPALAEYAPADTTAAQLSLAAAGLVNTAAQQCQPTSVYCGGRCVPTDKDRPACITSISVPGTTRAAGVTLQGRKPGPPGMPPTAPTTLTCDVGGVPGTQMKYSGQAFDPASFM